MYQITLDYTIDYTTTKNQSHVFLTTSGCGVSDPATIHSGPYLDNVCIVVLITCDQIH